MRSGYWFTADLRSRALSFLTIMTFFAPSGCVNDEQGKGMGGKDMDGRRSDCQAGQIWQP